MRGNIVEKSATIKSGPNSNIITVQNVSFQTQHVI